MALIWDYDEKKLQKTASGRRLILERMINYGPGKKKIKLAEVKKNWDTLQIYPKMRKLLSLLIWGKYRSSPQDKKSHFFCKLDTLPH
jgi:hypothetical protein